MIVNAFSSVSGGLPSSVTTIRKLYVEPPSDSDGVQTNRPVTGSMVAPGGTGPLPPFIEKVSASAGRSGSVAEAKNESVDPSSTVFGPIGPRTGGRLTALTVTRTVAVALSPVPSLTEYKMVWTPADSPVGE